MDQARKGMVKYMPKGQDPELCPITVLSQWLLDPHLGAEPEAPLFLACRNSARSVGKSTFRENLKTALKSSNLPNITAHGFRAGFASAALEGGADIGNIQICSAWAEPRSLEPYVQHRCTARLEMVHKAGI